MQGSTRGDMNFNNFLINFDGSIYGSGNDPVGSFDITGKLTGNQVTFKKQYHGAHSVDYNGTMNNGKITGNWNMSGATGSFEISAVFDSWTGFYEQGGQKHNVSITMTVDQNGIFGTGSDDIGQFVIRGQVQNQVAQFSKTYLGKHTVNYHGQMLTENGNKIIRGWWNATGANGGFELRAPIGGGGGGMGNPFGGSGGGMPNPFGGAGGMPSQPPNWGGQPPNQGNQGGMPWGGNQGGHSNPWGGQGHGHGHGHGHGNAWGNQGHGNQWGGNQGAGGMPPNWGNQGNQGNSGMPPGWGGQPPNNQQGGGQWNPGFGMPGNNPNTWGQPGNHGPGQGW